MPLQLHNPARALHNKEIQRQRSKPNQAEVTAQSSPNSMAAQTVLGLQRTIGNQAVVRLLRSERANSTGPKINRVQRKTVSVAGGEFNDALIGGGYQATNEDESDSTGTYEKVGAKMELAFAPKPGLEAEQVSLVQTTNSTVRNQTNPKVADQSHSLLGERRTEGGSAIDQEIYLSKKTIKSGEQTWDTARLLPLFQSMAGLGTQTATNDTIQKFITYFTAGFGANNGVVSNGPTNPNSIKIQLNRALAAEGGAANPILTKNIPEILKIIDLQAKSVNLDPRYSEERGSTDEALKAPRAAGNEVGSGGWTAVKEGGLWKTNAALRDAPGHKIKAGDVVNGDEHFETAAMADGKEFLGSIRWGYTVTNSVSALNPASIELVNYGSASAELYKAAKLWNAMKVPDMYNEDIKHSTLQLPESDGAKASAATAFELARWIPSGEVEIVLSGLGRATIERHYNPVALGHIREGVGSVDELLKLVIRLTEVRGPAAVNRLGDASQEYATTGYKALCAKPVDQIIAAIYT